MGLKTEAYQCRKSGGKKCLSHVQRTGSCVRVCTYFDISNVCRACVNCEVFIIAHLHSFHLMMGLCKRQVLLLST